MPYRVGVVLYEGVDEPGAIGPCEVVPARPAGLGLALHRGEPEWGSGLADAVPEGMEYERTGDVHGVQVPSPHDPRSARSPSQRRRPAAR